jgi:hypothetical protein
MKIGGDERDRTVGLLSAIQALSQLSYIPIAPDRGRARRYSTQRRPLCNRRLGAASAGQGTMLPQLPAQLKVAERQDLSPMQLSQVSAAC